MASISTDKRGSRRIYFTDSQSRRKGLRLGKVPKKLAESIKLRVEEIRQDQTFNRAHSSELANWISGLSGVMAEKMVAVGLLSEAPATMTVEALIETFLAGSDVKSSKSIRCFVPNATTRCASCHSSMTRRSSSASCGMLAPGA